MKLSPSQIRLLERAADAREGFIDNNGFGLDRTRWDRTAKSLEKLGLVKVVISNHHMLKSRCWITMPGHMAVLAEQEAKLRREHICPSCGLRGTHSPDCQRLHDPRCVKCGGPVKQHAKEPFFWLHDNSTGWYAGRQMDHDVVAP